MELSTSVHTLNQLESLSRDSLKPFDMIYLGDAFACEYCENLNMALTDLKKAVNLVKSLDRKACVSTFAVPRNSDLPQAEALMRFIAEEKLPVDGIEIHNYGLISMAREILGSTPLFAGSLCNIYTSATVELLSEQGVKRISPAYELTLKELEILLKMPPELELLVHGPMALGISEKCPALFWAGGEGSEEELSQKTILLKSDKMELRIRGRATFSGKDLCLIEHMNSLLNMGFKTFRIEWTLQDESYLKTAGGFYREAIDHWTAGNPLDKKILSQYAEEMVKLNPSGICNGFLFEQSGSDYKGFETR